MANEKNKEEELRDALAYARIELEEVSSKLDFNMCVNRLESLDLERRLQERVRRLEAEITKEIKDGN